MNDPTPIPTGSLIIRFATQQDADAIAGMAIAFRNHLERDTPSDTGFHCSVAFLLAADDASFLIASEAGQPLGYLVLRYRYSMWADGVEATLEDLFVDPAARRGGVGRALVEEALQHATRRGCCSICLDTNEHNAASTRIYRQLGFNEVSRRWNGRQLFFRRSLG